MLTLNYLINICDYVVQFFSVFLLSYFTVEFLNFATQKYSKIQFGQPFSDGSFDFLLEKVKPIHQEHYVTYDNSWEQGGLSLFIQVV